MRASPDSKVHGKMITNQLLPQIYWNNEQPPNSVDLQKTESTTFLTNKFSLNSMYRVTFFIGLLEIKTSKQSGRNPTEHLFYSRSEWSLESRLCNVMPFTGSLKIAITRVDMAEEIRTSKQSDL